VSDRAPKEEAGINRERGEREGGLNGRKKIDARKKSSGSKGVNSIKFSEDKKGR